MMSSWEGEIKFYNFPSYELKKQKDNKAKFNFIKKPLIALQKRDDSLWWCDQIITG